MKSKRHTTLVRKRVKRTILDDLREALQEIKKTKDLNEDDEPVGVRVMLKDLLDNGWEVDSVELNDYGDLILFVERRRCDND